MSAGSDAAEAARSLYEEVTGRLRRVTLAAWLRWDDLPPEAQDQWLDVTSD